MTTNDDASPEVESVWKASDGRLLRVVGCDGRRVAVRNVASGRLSYIQLRYFQGVRGTGWWLERHETPLLAHPVVSPRTED